MTKAPNPGTALLCKLGSIVVHVEEALGPHGHPVDVLALKSALEDPEVRAWLNEMHRLGLVPVIRFAGKLPRG